MMAAIFLVLAVVDAALLANVALTNTSAASVSEMLVPSTGSTPGCESCAAEAASSCIRRRATGSSTRWGWSTLTAT